MCQERGGTTREIPSAIGAASPEWVGQFPPEVEEECQNTPLADSDETMARPPYPLQHKQNGHERREIPAGANRLVAFVDVHADALYYMVCAFADDFTGYVVDYGTYPDQECNYFRLLDVRRTLAMATANQSPEAAIFDGLDRLTEMLTTTEYLRDDGSTIIRMDKILIDGTWSERLDIVEVFCRTSKHSAILMVSRGLYYGARHKPICHDEKKVGERLNRYYHWRITQAQPRQVRHVVWDANWWKSFTYARLAATIGDRGGLSIFSSDDHRMFAEHLASEYPVSTECGGRTVYEWKQRPNMDSHFLGCVTGCMVAASMLLSPDDDAKNSLEAMQALAGELYSHGADMIVERRSRQIDRYPAGHDDAHGDGELAKAAECYLWEAIAPDRDGPGDVWPWDAKDWKPGSTIDNLVEAGAFIAAEIDRLLRAEKEGSSPQSRGDAEGTP